MKMSFKIKTDALKAGMILADDVYWNGNLLLSKGIVVKNDYIIKLITRGVSKVTILADKTYYDDIFLNPVEKFYAETYEALAKILEKLKEEDKISISDIFPIVENILEAIYSSQNAILSLTGLRGEKNYYYSHSLDVCIYSLIAARVMNLRFEDAVTLGIGAILHDIGKGRIPSEILFKKEKLSSDEFEEVKKHSEYGYDILIKCPQVNYSVLQIVLQHHERVNGTGYPKQIYGKDMNFLSKIVAIADIYDAMTSDRVYKKKILPHEAAEYLHSISDTLIDGEIAKVFINNIAIYPNGCQVLLNTNEIAIVIESNSNAPLRPVLKIITDRLRNPISVPRRLELEKSPKVSITQVFS